MNESVLINLPMGLLATLSVTCTELITQAEKAFRQFVNSTDQVESAGAKYESEGRPTISRP